MVATKYVTQSGGRRLLIRFIAAFFMIIFMSAGLCASSFAAKKVADVLIINSYHSSLLWSKNIYTGVKSVMETLPFPVDIHSEFMDTKYIYTSDYLDMLENLYRVKYSGSKPDIIIASDDNALAFLVERGERIFPGVPTVFMGVNDFDKSKLKGRRDITGVVENLSIAGTIDVALRLYPRTNKVVAYASKLPTALYDSKIFLKTQKEFAGRVKLELKSGMTLESIAEDISKLPQDTVVLILSFLRSANGRTQSLVNSAAKLSAVNSIPIFSFWDFMLGHGIVGGQLVSGVSQGEIAGGIAARILEGEKPEQIPVVRNSSNKYMFDGVQLKRLGYNPAGLPHDAIIINEEQSFYSQHKGKVWGTFAVFFVMGTVIILFWRSATARKDAELELLRSKEIYDLAAKGTNDGIWDWDKSSDQVFFSPRWKEILGYKEDEILNDIEEWKSRIHADDYNRVIKANDDFFLQGGDRFQIEYRMQAKDGSYRWIMGRGSCLRDEDGQPYRIAGAHTDITERKKDEEELHRLRNYLESIINSMPSILVGVDNDGLISLWNSKAEELTGLSSEKACGMKFSLAFPVIADDYDRIMSAIKAGVMLVDPPRVLNLKDESRYRELAVFPLNCDGKCGAVIRIDDVTQRVRLEQMMVQTEKMMSLGGLAAGMAHEINNPLAGILGNLHNLRRRFYSDLSSNEETAKSVGLSLEVMRAYLDKRDIPKLLDGIANSAGRAATIVRNMLSFSRKSEKLFEYHNIEQLLEETLELASSDYDLTRSYDFKKIEIVRNYASSLPAVYCDGTEIRQVFLNLIKNAAEATAEKEYEDDNAHIYLSTEVDSEMVVIVVEDNGPGLTEEQQKRVFEPFYTSKPVGSGTGLGLSVSYFIITDQHKGIMQVESSAGEWTRFIIRLPAG